MFGNRKVKVISKKAKATSEKSQTLSRKTETESRKPQVLSKKAEAELKKAKAKKIKAKPQKILAKAKKKKAQPIKFSEKALEKDILKEAKVLKISSETAGKYAKLVAEKVASWVGKRSAVTQADINSQIAKEIKKYNKDLAFIYNNRGKII